MVDFSAFMAQNKIQRQNVKFVASKSFVDKDGKPMEWEIRPITSTEDEELRKQCTRQVKVNGKANRQTLEMDTNAYLGKLAATCTVFPDLTNTELQKSYGVMGNDNLLKVMLSPGEFAEYVNKISEINDFDVDLSDKVEEAKN